MNDLRPGTPAVSVIIPTFNAMPYLRRCLDSILEQTIGPDRLQVIAVDDGSTDGGGELLNEVAAQHPDTFEVVHQPNSGGPALPCNRGLELARGRWVYFLGADDYLAPNALERLVEQGDAWESDIIFGTMQGEGGRFVDQRIYRKTVKDLDFSDPALAYSLSNTKLFRRGLLVDHNVRYALDLRVGSDQTFVVQAMTHARRVSVLADQVYYHAVKRADLSNITYTMDWRTRLADTASVMEHIAEVRGPGSVRDAIFVRHFTWEISKLLRRDLPALDESEQHELLAGVAALYERFDTPGLDDLLGPRTRVRLRLAQTDQVDLLRRVLDYQATRPRPPIVLRNGTGYLWMPGFGTDTVSDRWYRLSEKTLARQVGRSMKVTSVALDDRALEVAGQIGVTADSADGMRMALVGLGSGGRSPRPSRLTAAQADADHGSDATGGTEIRVRLVSADPADPGAYATFTVTLPVTRSVSEPGAEERRWAIRLRIRHGGAVDDLPVAWDGASTRRLLFGGWQVNRLTVRADNTGHLIMVARRLPRWRALRARLGRLRRSLFSGRGASVSGPSADARERPDSASKGEQ